MKSYALYSLAMLLMTSGKPPEFLHFSSTGTSSRWMNRSIIVSPSLQMTNYPWKGCGYVTSPILGAPSISQEWQKLELSNLVHRYAISSHTNQWKITTKRGVVMVTWPI